MRANKGKQIEIFSSKWRPIVSLFVLVTSLFVVMFFKMEVRRMGYVLLKANKSEKLVLDEHRRKTVVLARLLGPQRLHQYAENRLDMKVASFGQLIQIAEQKIAIKQ